MATRGSQKVDEKKIQQAVETWLKRHRAAVQDKNIGEAVAQFKKSYQKEISDRGNKIIRRVIAEGRTSGGGAGTSGTSTSTRQSTRTSTANTRGVQKPAPSGIKGAVKSATDKAGSAVKTATKAGRIARGAGTGAMAALYSEELGGGKDTRTAKYTEETAQELGKQLKEKMAKAGIGGSKGSHTVKRGDTMSAIAQRAGVTLKELKAANPQIENINQIKPGQKIKLPKQSIKGTGKSIYAAKGGMIKANCGASMKPTQKSSQTKGKK